VSFVEAIDWSQAIKRLSKSPRLIGQFWQGVICLAERRAQLIHSETGDHRLVVLAFRTVNPLWLGYIFPWFLHTPPHDHREYNSLEGIKVCTVTAWG
jgi:hypothetical protein